MSWNNIEDKKPPKSAAIIAICDDGKTRTLWRCGCNDQWCEIYRDEPYGAQLSIEIIKWKLR